MTNENTVTLFACKDAAVDGCPNVTDVADTHCADCAEFHASMAETRALLNDDSWKPNDSIAAVDAALAPLVTGFEVVEVAPVVESPEDKPDLDSVCYTMNAAEIDCQQALFQIADIMRNLSKSLNDLDNAIEIVESNLEREGN
jgi:hypothetical protein